MGFVIPGLSVVNKELAAIGAPRYLGMGIVVEVPTSNTPDGTIVNLAAPLLRATIAVVDDNTCLFVAFLSSANQNLVASIVIHVRQCQSVRITPFGVDDAPVERIAAVTGVVDSHTPRCGARYQLVLRVAISIAGRQPHHDFF